MHVWLAFVPKLLAGFSLFRLQSRGPDLCHAAGSFHKIASFAPERANHCSGALHYCCCIVLEPHCVRAVDATRRPAAEMSAPPCWAESEVTSNCQPVLVFCDCDCVHSNKVTLSIRLQRVMQVRRPSAGFAHQQGLLASLPCTTMPIDRQSPCWPGLYVCSSL